MTKDGIDYLRGLYQSNVERKEQSVMEILIMEKTDITDNGLKTKCKDNKNKNITKENNMKTKMIDIVDLKQLVKEGKLDFIINDDVLYCRDLRTEESISLGKAKYRGLRVTANIDEYNKIG